MDYYEDLASRAASRNRIEHGLYGRFGTKRGLRNEDGSGVLVGLTRISGVLGYEKTDGGVVPVEGRLAYRGIDIRDLVACIDAEKRFGFEETVYLLLFGDLPSAAQRVDFSETLGGMRAVPRNFPRDILQTFRTRDIMNALARSVLTLYSKDRRADDLSLPNQVQQSMQIIARLATLVPYAYYVIDHAFRHRSLIIHKVEADLSTAENLLRLLRTDSRYTELEARVLDICLILHAEHGGGNNSTFVTRAVSSTMTDIYSAMAAAIGSLKGPLHGGANAQVIRMMRDLRRQVGQKPPEHRIRDYLLRLLRREAYDRAGKIYGMGHAVYTLSDPRAVVLREYARKLAEQTGREREFELLTTVERVAPEVIRDHRKDPDFVLCANVDFYSGFVYESLGIPLELFTPLFAVARVAGWCAHRLEVLSNPVKILRPAYKALCEHDEPVYSCRRCAEGAGRMGRRIPGNEGS